MKKNLSYLKIYGDWLVKFKKLRDDEFGKLIRAATDYQCNGKEPDLDGAPGLAFDWLRPVLDHDKELYIRKVTVNSENGKLGADHRWGKDSERHTENGERYLTDGENSQEQEEDSRLKIEDSRLMIEHTAEQDRVVGKERDQFFSADVTNFDEETERQRKAAEMFNLAAKMKTANAQRD